MADTLSLPSATRRDILIGAGALLVAAGLPAARAHAGGAVAAPNAYVRIAADDTVTVIVRHLEMGQGVVTGLATLVAEELDADWAQMRHAFSPADDKLYANDDWGAMGTGGSSSLHSSWVSLRRAAAQARAVLVAAAAKRWSVPTDEIAIAKGVVRHQKSGRTARFGDLAGDAAALPIPEKVSLKPPSDWTSIGTSPPRLDGPAKRDGSAIFTIDVKLPGLRTALIARPPAIGAKLARFDASEALKIPGVVKVVEVAEGVAVVAEGMWPALKGREALKIDWRAPAEPMRPVPEILRAYRDQLSESGIVARAEGDVMAAEAERRIEAVYEFPYLAHAPMEPLNCVVRLADGRLETWSGHQLQTTDLAAAAREAGVDPAHVTINTLISGGGFGRRGALLSDYVVEAVHVAKALGDGQPVRVQRTREDDMRAGFYRPACVHGVSLGIDASGRPVLWDQHYVGQSIYTGTVWEEGLVRAGVDESCVEGFVGMPYAVPNVRMRQTIVVQPVRAHFWRSVGHSHGAYVVETLIDEAAALANADPVDYRMGLLGDRIRAKRVLALAAKEAGWGKALPKGHARGVAVHTSFDTVVAEVAEVTLASDGTPRVTHVTAAVDCGLAVNPELVRAQVEGAIAFGLSAALFGEVNFADGGVVEGNFDEYRVLRIDEMPRVDVHIVPSVEHPTGIGEPGLPPLAPAVANALAVLTGTRIRTLPFSKEKLVPI